MAREWKCDAGVRCVSFALGDKRFAVLTDPWGENPSVVNIFDTESNSDEPIQRIPMDFGVPRTNRALWGPLNKRIITCTDGGGLLSWDAEKGECIDERADHEGGIPDFTFSLDQMTLITASQDMSATVRACLLSCSAKLVSPAVLPECSLRDGVVWFCVQTGSGKLR